jgi:hypothetical protein
VVGSLAAVLFIAAAAAAGIYVGTKPTVISGKVMAATLLEQGSHRGIAKIDCDPQIPIGTTGAVFHCTALTRDGSTHRIAYTMDRAGALTAAIVDPVAPPAVPGDSWR